MSNAAHRARPNEPEERHPILKLAPKEFQCEWMIADTDGEKHRCSRFTLKKVKGGGREKYCVAHSRSALAKAHRSKAAKAQREVAEARRKELFDLAWELLPREWRRKHDFIETRFRLFHLLVRGDLSVPQCNALGALVRDAERNAMTQEGEWRPSFR